MAKEESHPQIFFNETRDSGFTEFKPRSAWVLWLLHRSSASTLNRRNPMSDEDHGAPVRTGGLQNHRDSKGNLQPLQVMERIYSLLITVPRGFLRHPALLRCLEADHRRLF